MTQSKSYSPIIFLASLGAGGIAVIPFAFLQFVVHTGKGLTNISHISHGSLPLYKQISFYSFEFLMILFAAIHIVLTVVLIRSFIKWMRSDNYRTFIEDPLQNAGILSPFISIIMTMNVFIGPIRFFVVPMAENLQSFMLPALLAWSIIWVLLMRMEIKLLKISFEKSFDVSKINFGWLLHPFALGMLTVTGTGIAAMAHNSSIAHTAAFLSLVSGSMGFFLFFVKLISIFKSHFAAEGLPEKQFLPSFLIVIPNITLYAISIFRLGHYFKHQWQSEPGIFFTVVITVAFAFETWYMLFGLALLKDYIQRHFFKREFYMSQWGLVCPFVAYAVLGSFLYNVFIPNPLVIVSTVLSMTVSIVIFAILLKRQLECMGVSLSSVKNIRCPGIKSAILDVR